MKVRFLFIYLTVGALANAGPTDSARATVDVNDTMLL